MGFLWGFCLFVCLFVCFGFWVFFLVVVVGGGFLFVCFGFFGLFVVCLFFFIEKHFSSFRSLTFFHMPINRRQNRLVGLAVKTSTSRAEDSGFESRLRRDFSGPSHTSDLKIGTPVATLPGVWHYRVSAGTGWPGISIL